MYSIKLLDKIKLNPETRRAKQLLCSYSHAIDSTLHELYKYPASSVKRDVWEAIKEMITKYGDQAKWSTLLWGSNFVFSVGFIDYTTVNIITRRFWYTIPLSLEDTAYKELIEHIKKVKHGF